MFDDIDDMSDYTIKLFLETVKQFIPQKKIVIDPKDKPWINAVVKAKIKERNKYHGIISKRKGGDI